MPTTVSTPRIVIVGGGMGGPAAAERTYVVHRADLLDTVKAAVPADWVRLGARCTAVEAGPFVAHLRFADGRQVEADVVIGADGYPIAGGQAGRATVGWPPPSAAACSSNSRRASMAISPKARRMFGCRPPPIRDAEREDDGVWGRDRAHSHPVDRAKQFLEHRDQQIRAVAQAHMRGPR